MKRVIEVCECVRVCIVCSVDVPRLWAKYMATGILVNDIQHFGISRPDLYVGLSVRIIVSNKEEAIDTTWIDVTSGDSAYTSVEDV